MQFPFITYGMALYRLFNDKKKSLEFLLAFSHSKTAISFYILSVLLILCIFSGLKLHLQAVSFYYIYLWYMALHINASIPTKH